MPEMSAAGKPPVIAVTATDLDDDGAGVGAADGRQWHVPDLVPGESAEVAAVHHSPHQPASWGRIVARTSPPSADRARPVCPAFGRCGGCPWQHVAYPAQLAAKHRRVQRALGDLAAVAPPIAAPSPIHYRAKGKYVAGRTDGHLALGAWARDRHAFVDTAGCQLVMPVIDRARGAIVAAAAGARLAPADERRKTGHLRYAIVRAGRDGRVLVGLVVHGATPPAIMAATAAALTAAAPEVVGVVRLDNDRTDGGLLDQPPTPLVGAMTLDDQVAGVPVALGASEFAQVNPAQADALYAHVAALAEATPGTRAVDVYAGLGGIAFALARAGATVTAIERDASAIAALTAAAARAGLAVTGEVGDAARLAGFPAVDLVVVNPPRKGCSPATLAAATASSARRMIYVSCGPESLGRDLAALVAAGWRVDHAQPFDLMPATSQIETVVRLAR